MAMHAVIQAPSEGYWIGNVLFGASAYVADFVTSRIRGCSVAPGSYEALGVGRDGQLIAGVVYYNYEPRDRNIYVHIASDSPRWSAPSTMRVLFAYPFIQLDCVRITALIPRSNRRCREFTMGDRKRKGMGFREEGCHPLGFLAKEDLMSYGLLRKNCRFIPNEYRLKD